MSYNIGPYDIMRLQSQLSDFFDPYVNKVNINNSLLTQIEKTGEAIDRFFRDGVIDYTYPVMNVVIIGKAINSIEDLTVVKPDGSQWEKSIEEIYAKKLLTEENPWKTIYEIEVAQSCYSAGLNTKLVHEGQEAGPDVLVYCGDKRVDIECKRRDTYDTKKNYDYKPIREEILSNLDIGDDSFLLN
ncbi:hypothetical protein [Halobacteriaceae bacterium SHR40]|uniref:hypothetical protein n=1 Tax=Halovenus amylolytica TaxID=2500550 RepID=UPI000FE43D21